MIVIDVKSSQSQRPPRAIQELLDDVCHFSLGVFDGHTTF
jgi:hypothetical protein